MANASILVVEDERIVGKDIERRLLNLGYGVTGVVSTGVGALEELKETVPDLILMDIRLKGDMDGIEVAEAVRSAYDVPVVYLTAYADDATLDRAKAAGPFGYVLKPFSERELCAAVEMALYKHKMERRLTENQERLATTLRSIADGVITTDIDGAITFMNPIAEVSTGLKQADVAGRNFADFFSIMEEGIRTLPDDFIKRAIREGTGTGRAVHSTLSVRNGPQIPVDSSVAPIRNAKGAVTGSVLVFRDVTERKVAQEILQESEERFRLSFDQSPVGAAIVSLRLQFVRVNSELCRITGYLEEELVKLGFRGVIYREDLDASLEKARALKSGRVKQFQTDTRCVRKDGNVVWIHITAGVVKDGRGKPLYFLVNIEDIQERRRLEAQLAHSQEMKALGQLAAGVAHEVRNPLNAILAITEALFQEIGGNREYDPYLAHIRTQVNRLSALMKDLLELGKPIQSSLLRCESLKGICGASLELWRQTKASETHDGQLFSELDEDDVFVMVDASRLQQVFLNLLENAAQHSPEGSEVRLTVSGPVGGTVKVEVTDRGVGIPPDRLQQVFEPFFTTRRGGVGLGLSIVKHSVESMGGSVIALNNDPPPGCTISVVLPACEKADV